MDLVISQKLHTSTHPIGGLESIVGNTPLLPLHRLGSQLASQVQIYAKAEWFNPAGSIKDRPALNIIRTAIADGSLTPGKRLLDATSGNTGIAYATFGAAMGIPVTLTMPSNASQERIAILRALGAELILTDAMEGADGAIRKVQELLSEHPERYFHANQYDNPANWQAHFHTTGPEIIQQTEGTITHFVAGMGTSGTMTGVGRYLKQYNPAIRLIGGQPDTPINGIEGFKHMATAIVPGIYDQDLLDQTEIITTEAARQMVRRLAHEEGLLVGVSGAANAALALRVAQRLESGVVVTIFPDSGYKYLSDKALWEAEE